MANFNEEIMLFSLETDALTNQVAKRLSCTKGQINQRQFPDGEAYLRVMTDVRGLHCIVIANLSFLNNKYLSLVFLTETLKDLGALSVGLVAPYLPYMRQDKRFNTGEAVSSRIFAADLSTHIDWLVTFDPHLHRYHDLNEIYRVPSQAIPCAPLLANWLKPKANLLLVGPDSESEQWVCEIARYSGHDYVIGNKCRKGDRDVEINLPDLSGHAGKSVFIIDDVISSGHTVLKCVLALQAAGFSNIGCIVVHGIFADDCDNRLLKSGVQPLITCNTIVHESNRIDVSELLIPPILNEINALKGV